MSTKRSQICIAFHVCQSMFLEVLERNLGLRPEIRTSSSGALPPGSGTHSFPVKPLKHLHSNPVRVSRQAALAGQPAVPIYRVELNWSAEEAKIAHARRLETKKKQKKTGDLPRKHSFIGRSHVGDSIL